MEPIFKMVYISSSSSSIDKNGIDAIVKAAEVYNPKVNISGALLYHSGFFLQLLEGPEKDVRNLYKKIEHDPRHSNIIVLIEISDNNRICPDWSMAFREMSDLDLNIVNKILAWTKLVNRSPQIDNKLVLEILERFKIEYRPKK